MCSIQTFPVFILRRNTEAMVLGNGMSRFSLFVFSFSRIQVKSMCRVVVCERECVINQVFVRVPMGKGVSFLYALYRLTTFCFSCTRSITDEWSWMDFFFLLVVSHRSGSRRVRISSSAMVENSANTNRIESNSSSDTDSSPFSHSDSHSTQLHSR